MTSFRMGRHSIITVYDVITLYDMNTRQFVTSSYCMTSLLRIGGFRAGFWREIEENAAFACGGTLGGTRR